MSDAVDAVDPSVSTDAGAQTPLIGSPPTGGGPPSPASPPGSTPDGVDPGTPLQQPNPTFNTQITDFPAYQYNGDQYPWASEPNSVLFRGDPASWQDYTAYNAQGLPWLQTGSDGHSHLIQYDQNNNPQYYNLQNDPIYNDLKGDMIPQNLTDMRLPIGLMFGNGGLGSMSKPLPGEGIPQNFPSAAPPATQLAARGGGEIPAGLPNGPYMPPPVTQPGNTAIGGVPVNANGMTPGGLQVPGFPGPGGRLILPPGAGGERDR